eukprot:scaffold14939_cov215-Amphora_coffeaeformis.AAC.1
MSGSALQGFHQRLTRQSWSLSCQRCPLDLRPYRALTTIKMLSNDTNILLTDERVINPTTDKCK